MSETCHKYDIVAALTTKISTAIHLLYAYEEKDVVMYILFRTKYVTRMCGNVFAIKNETCHKYVNVLTVKNEACRKYVW